MLVLEKFSSFRKSCYQKGFLISERHVNGKDSYVGSLVTALHFRFKGYLFLLTRCF